MMRKQFLRKPVKYYYRREKSKYFNINQLNKLYFIIMYRSVLIKAANLLSQYNFRQRNQFNTIIDGIVSNI